LCASRVYGVADILLNIARDCWVFPLIEKGFPRILVFLCMVILHVILVFSTLVYGIAVSKPDPWWMSTLTIQGMNQRRDFY
jgi:hypothetical protein